MGGRTFPSSLANPEGHGTNSSMGNFTSALAEVVGLNLHTGLSLSNHNGQLVCLNEGKLIPVNGAVLRGIIGRRVVTSNS
jgi:hypothetical protein